MSEQENLHETEADLGSHEIPAEDAELGAEDIEAIEGEFEDDASSDQMIAEMERLQNQCADLEDKYRRALADFQNFQRRAVTNERESKEQGKRSVVEGIIPVLDTVDLAMNQDAETMTVLQIAQGFDAIRSQLMDSLGRFGVARLTAEPGDDFVPGKHEAVMQQAAEGIAPGKISAFFQAGYTLGDRVVRPAKVAVAPGE
ncbi:MAG: nucleotide exchange factor GrpE [Planctomycetota bacterium]